MGAPTTGCVPAAEKVFQSENVADAEVNPPDWDILILYSITDHFRLWCRRAAPCYPSNVQRLNTVSLLSIGICNHTLNWTRWTRMDRSFAPLFRCEESYSLTGV
jgi:hypothetical protein